MSRKAGDSKYRSLAQAGLEIKPNPHDNKCHTGAAINLRQIFRHKLKWDYFEYQPNLKNYILLHGFIIYAYI
jgi:hypothetical protein